VNVWDVEEAMKWADTWGPTDGVLPTGDQLALATLARVVRAAGAELASMRMCFEAADAERRELRERAMRAEAELARVVAAERERWKEPTDEQVADACLWSRHDFGLLPDEEKRIAMSVIREHWRAVWKACNAPGRGAQYMPPNDGVEPHALR